MTENKIFRRGEQIAYIPTHAEGDITHPDVEIGFVTSQHGDTVWCRYWRKNHPGELRTVSNSEGTPIDMLVHYQSVEPDVIRLWFKEYDALEPRG